MADETPPESLTDEQIAELGDELLRDTENAVTLNEAITAKWRRYGAALAQRRLHLVRGDDTPGARE